MTRAGLWDSLFVVSSLLASSTLFAAPLSEPFTLFASAKAMANNVMTGVQLYEIRSTKPSLTLPGCAKNGWTFVFRTQNDGGEARVELYQGKNARSGACFWTRHIVYENWDLHPVIMWGALSEHFDTYKPLSEVTVAAKQKWPGFLPAQIILTLEIVSPERALPVYRLRGFSCDKPALITADARSGEFLRDESTIPACRS